jgi:hypothetical protein
MGDLYMCFDRLSNQSKNSGRGIVDSNKDPYKEIMSEMAQFEAKRTRFFWGTLAVLMISVVWLMIRLNDSGGFDGLFR